MADTERNELEPMMTVEEVAQVLRMHVQTVYEKARKGEIPSVKIGAKRLFPRERIRDLLTPVVSEP